MRPPREGWFVLLDADKREIVPRIPVVVRDDPLDFTVEVGSDVPSHVRYARVIDADGNTRDVPL